MCVRVCVVAVLNFFNSSLYHGLRKSYSTVHDDLSYTHCCTNWTPGDFTVTVVKVTRGLASPACLVSVPLADFPMSRKVKRTESVVNAISLQRKRKKKVEKKGWCTLCSFVYTPAIHTTFCCPPPPSFLPPPPHPTPPPLHSRSIISCKCHSIPSRSALVVLNFK